MLLDDFKKFINENKTDCENEENNKTTIFNIKDELLNNFSCPLNIEQKLEEPKETEDETKEEEISENLPPFNPDDLINEMDKYNYILFKWGDDIQIKNMPEINEEYKSEDVLLEFKKENTEYKKLILSRSIKIKETGKNFILSKNIKNTFIQKNVIDKIKTLKEYLSEYKKLKDKQFFLRFELVHLNVILNFYKKANEVYGLFFNNFKTVFETIKQLEDKINETIEKIKTIDENISKQIVFSLDVSNLIKERNGLVDELNDLVLKLNITLGTLQSLRNQSPYFEISDSIVNAYLNFSKISEDSNDITKIKNEIANKKTEYISPQTGISKNTILNYKEQIENISKKMFKYSNNFYINDINIGSSFENVNTKDKIKINFNEIKEEDILLEQNNIKIIIDRSIPAEWKGEIYKEYNSFINKIFSQNNSNLDIEELNNVTFINMDNLSNELSDLILINAQDYAFYVLSKENVYINLVESPNEELKKQYEETNVLFNKKNEELKKTEDKLKFIKETINEIKNLSLNFNDNIVFEEEMEIDGTKELVGVVMLRYDTKEDEFQEDSDVIDLNFNGISKKPGFDSDVWWKKFNNLATIVNASPSYYAVGFYAAGNPVYMPIAWKHIKTINLPSGIIEIGIAACGVAVAPYFAFFNFSDFPLMSTPKEGAKFILAIKPNVLISNKVKTKISDPPKLSFMGFKYEKDANITKTKIFIKDDLPAMERMSISNPYFLTFLNKWCSAGKLSQGL